MKCPNCGHPDHRVVYARETKEGGVRRRRECLKCAFRWFTVEASEAVYQKAAEVVETFRELQKKVGEA
jgi:transcriptional regulator NrdR family protein